MSTQKYPLYPGRAEPLPCSQGISHSYTGEYPPEEIFPLEYNFLLPEAIPANPLPVPAAVRIWGNE